MAPTVVCLPPVKNGEWLLDRFLQCASLWADHIIVADQNSTDRSREIARRYEKVHLVENSSEDYDEAKRQKLLVEEARNLTSKPRLLVALDADEILTANALSSEEWETTKSAAPGTVIEFPKIELFPSPARYFRHSAQDEGDWHALGYVDDGVEYSGTKIHSNSVPVPEGAPHLQFNEVGVLHYQFCDWSRMESKHRWYRCYERLEFPQKRGVEINRKYSWMYRQSFETERSPEEWTRRYEEEGIDMTTIRSPAVFWWDWEVLRMFEAHGTEQFKGLDIWDVDWERLRQIGLTLGKDGLPQTAVQSPQGIGQRIGLYLSGCYRSPRSRRFFDPLVSVLLE
jgi:glycosyltransferase involved in cell wall biosynthesis